MTHWYSPPALFWLSSYVTSYHLPVVPQLDLKDEFYCAAYFITLDSSCEAQRASKKIRRE
jgi:hypothetical protein